MSRPTTLGAPVVLAVPQIRVGEASHPGGQLTAANGLVDYFERNGLPYTVLNTMATNYPPTPIWLKFFQSMKRIYTAWRLVAGGKSSGFLAFSNFGLSFFERCVISLVHRLYGLPSLVFFRSTEIFGQKSTRFRRFYISIFLRSPDFVVVQGQALKAAICRLRSKHVEVIPNWLPVDCHLADQAKSYPKDGIVNFVFVGWLERKKGIPELLDAVVKTKSLSDRYRLYIVGNGSLSEYVSARISKEGLSHVFQLGWLGNSQVHDLLRDMHVFILPSHTEGFPNALLEALASGLPAIATGVGAIPDVLVPNSNGFIVDVNDSYAISVNIQRYISDRSLIPLHSKAALAGVAESHDRNINCKRLLDLLFSRSNPTVIGHDT